MENKRFLLFSSEKLLSCSASGINNDIAALNAVIAEKGLYLPQNDVREIVRVRMRALVENCRFEIGIASIEKIVNSIYTSPFVNRSNFTETLCTFIRLFYYIKTASYDSISDEDVIRVLKDMYENVCYGSLKEMKGKEVDIILNYIDLERKRRQPSEEAEVGT